VLRAEGGELLYRIHDHDREPNWFNATGAGRFDPPAPDAGFGTCYLAADLDGALIEVLGRVRVITETDVYRRSVTAFRAAVDLEVANFSDPSIVGRYGLTATASAGNVYTYPMCQQWAAALRSAGLDGIRYHARHDPSAASQCYALFGGPGLDDKPIQIVTTTPLIETVEVSWALHRFGFQVLPPTALP
jgi:RES domain-containing protein